ncbi:MAG: hypothetical protein HOK41_06380 [Nitrospina sp.]|jgi:hypothetical protein|nr:hypothetical protein [Nitrospina sp.]
MLKVFISDMTHTYVALANGSFPLGASYVASYLKKVLGDKIDLSIFKYPSDLQENITNGNHPDVFMFSSYYWNQNLGLAFAEEIKNINEKTLVVTGGPNISKDMHKQKEFLESNPCKVNSLIRKKNV